MGPTHARSRHILDVATPLHIDYTMSCNVQYQQLPINERHPPTINIAFFFSFVPLPIPRDVFAHLIFFSAIFWLWGSPGPRVWKTSVEKPFLNRRLGTQKTGAIRRNSPGRPRRCAVRQYVQKYQAVSREIAWVFLPLIVLRFCCYTPIGVFSPSVYIHRVLQNIVFVTVPDADV